MAAKKPSEEHALQNAIRNELAGECLLFRANVGTGWQGAGKPERYSKPTTVVINRGDVVLRKARPFDTGLPAGFSDLFGVTSITITESMVGKRVGVFFAMEVKDQATASHEQANFLQAVKDNGGIAGIAKSTEDARRIVRKPSAKMLSEQEKLIQKMIDDGLIHDTRFKGGNDDN